MFKLSPLTQKRLRSFKRIKRAWYSLLALGAIFVFCTAAELVSPQDPRKVVDTAELEKYREPVTVRHYEVRDARWSVLADGTVTDYEGPADAKAALVAGETGGYTLTRTENDGYTRVYARSNTEPKIIEEVLKNPDGTVKKAEIAFPFRPCREHIFGIDAGGRDVYARVVHGMRIGLWFGLLLAFWAMFLGLVVGAVEGYFGGLTDILCQRFTEIWSAVPFLYVMIFIGSTVGRSFTVLLVCYGIFNWIAVSYYMRAEYLRLRSRTFVEAAKCQGFSAARIIFGHILPNALTPLITLFPFLLMGAIGSLAALDFLGFGLPPMTPSCGELMNQAQQFRWAWWLILFPALALFIVMLLTVLVGEGLRDAFDPRQKSKLE